MVQFAGAEGYALVADLYDHDTAYRNRRDVAFFVQAAHESGGPVLEIGCGTGRILIPTARAGINIVGLDLSQEMLGVCHDSLSREPIQVQSRTTLVQEDMRNFELARAFKLVTLPFRPFQHLITVEEQQACLTSIHRHLLPGGRVILDLFNPSGESLMSDYIGREIGDLPEFAMQDGRRVVRRHRFVSVDRVSQINEVELIYYVTHPDGRTERLVQAFPMRYLYRFEAEHLLARCGFQVDEVYADYDKSPYGSKYPGELILLATKVEGQL